MLPLNINAFPLKPSVLKKLQQAGFTSYEEILASKPVQLSREANISHEDAVEALTTLRNASDVAQSTWAGNSALSLLHEELNSLQGIRLFCPELDHILGGGIPVGQVSEFCGSPGAGKTQLAIQSAVNVQIPRELGGLEGRAIYIDTEGSFVIDRVAEIACGTINVVQREAANLSEEDFQITSEKIKKFTLEEILSNIIYYRVHDYLEQTAVVRMLEDILIEQPNIKLIIIDSIAFHFRHDVNSLSLRNRLLNMSAQTLMKLSKQHQLAVVVINQMTTKLNSTGEADLNLSSLGATSRLAPALGESWGHACTNRTLLTYDGVKRTANLFKSPNLKIASARYTVTADGLRPESTTTTATTALEE